LYLLKDSDSSGFAYPRQQRKLRDTRWGRGLIRGAYWSTVEDLDIVLVICF